MAVNFLLKRSNTASKRPTAAQLDIGELSLNYDANTAGVFFEDGAGNVRKVGPAEVSATAPNATPAGSSGNSLGEFWYDTGATNLKIWTGSAFVNATASITGNAGTVTNGVYTTGAQTIGGTKTFSSQIIASGGIQPGATDYPNYEALIDFGSDVANTWRRLVQVVAPNIQYSTIGFKIDVVDPQANHATTNSVDQIRTETYYVACVRANDVTLDVPDACYVRGPSNRIRATKTAVGTYEIHIQNAAQFREYRVNISVYAYNGAQVVSYFDGDTANAGTAQYNASASTGSYDFFQGIQTFGNVLPGTTNTYNLGAAGTVWSNVYATTFTGALSGNSTTATSLSGGSIGTIPYQSGTNTTAMLAVGTAGQALVSAGAAAPTWATLTMENIPDAAFKRSVRAATTADLGASTFAAGVLTGYDDVVALNVDTTLSSTTATTTSTAGIKVGAVISGNANIPAATTVASITNATTFVMSAAATAAGTAVATTFTQTISALVVDGITLALNDRVLVKNQSTLGGLADANGAAKNGIYRLSTLGSATVPWVLTRAADADTASEIAGALVNVDSGTTNGGFLFDTDFKSTDTLNTTLITWNRIVDTGLGNTTAATIAMNGTQAAGTSDLYARADHVHPTDTSRAATNQTMFIGTTSVAINRASAAQSLTGITSIDGSAATLTTTRTIWGQNFNGSANVSGAISGATNILAGSGTSGAVTTPPYLSLGANFTNTTLRANCKVRLYENGADIYGFSIGSAGDVQYHSTTTHQFYNSDVATFTVNATGATSTGIVQGTRFTSTVATGTAPLTVASTTLVTNLNADLLDGIDSEAYSRLVHTTAIGGTLAADGANTWTKIATFSTGTTQFADCTLILSITDTVSSQHDSAIISVFFRSNATSTNPTVDVRILSKGGTGSFIVNDSFKVISGAWSTDMELWMKKGNNYGQFAVYETSKRSQGGTLTYNASPAWQSATPTGAVNNVSTDGVYEGLKITSASSITGSQLVSTVATGTAPLTVASTTLVTNLNADLLDGLNSASTNTASTIVARDASGNFSAGTITATLTGNASTATTLATTRTLWGQNFNGGANVTGSLTSVGDITGSAAVTLSSAAASALNLNSGTTGAVTLDSGTTGSVSIGNNANAKTITLGNVTGATTINVNSGTGGILVTSPHLTMANQGALRLREATGGGTNYIGLQAPAAVAADLTFTVPGTDATTTTGYTLKSNGSAALSFGTANIVTSDTAPSSPLDGDLWYDSASGRLFVYYADANTNQWVDASPDSSGVSNIRILDSIAASFNGTTATFNLTVSAAAVSPVNAQQLLIVVGGVVQMAGTHYTVSGSTITFTAGNIPTSGLTFYGVIYGAAVTQNTVADNAITTSKLQNASVTAAKLSIDGNVLPTVDNTYDLGSASFRFANIFTGDLHLKNDRGDWTIIEEDDCLTMRNNKTGKIYEIMMKERTA